MSQIPSPRPALDRCCLETRCKNIEIAAALDRIDRGPGAVAPADASRLARIRTAIEVLLSDEPNRAERCQMAFSLPYDAAWTAPNAR